MKPLILFVAALSALALAGCTSPGGDDEGTVVEMVNTTFSPKEITIDVGETVTWVNRDNFVHTATHSAENGTFDSGSVQTGGRFSHTFSEAGTYEYHCVPHASQNPDGEYQGMTGTIIVREATTA